MKFQVPSSQFQVALVCFLALLCLAIGHSPLGTALAGPTVLQPGIAATYNRRAPVSGGGGSITLLTSGQGAGSGITINTSGATLLVGYSAYNTTKGTFSDTLGNTFTAQPEWGAGSGLSTMYVCINPTHLGSDTFTSTGNGAGITIAAFSGTFTAVDQKTGHAVSGTSCSPGSITTTAAPELILAGLNWYNSSPSGSVTVDTGTSGFAVITQTTPGSIFGAVLAYRVANTTVTVNPVFTTPQNGGASCGQISIK